MSCGFGSRIVDMFFKFQVLLEMYAQVVVTSTEFHDSQSQCLDVSQISSRK